MSYGLRIYHCRHGGVATDSGHNHHRCPHQTAMREPVLLELSYLLTSPHAAQRGGHLRQRAWAEAPIPFSAASLWPHYQRLSTS